MKVYKAISYKIFKKEITMYENVLHKINVHFNIDLFTANSAFNENYC